MPKQLVVGTLVSVLGFVILLLGSLGYIGVLPLGETFGIVLMVIGILTIVGSVGAIYLPEKYQALWRNIMALFDKLKAAFGEKKSGSGSGGKTASQFKAGGKVGNALKYAGNKIDAQVKAGKFDKKKAAMYVATLKDIEASKASEDEKLIQIGQVIGAVIFT